jgi:hypothetical protein
MLLVADGLGHGAAAAEASTAAVRIFATHAASFPGVVDAIERIHDGLRATRGAAVAAATLDMDEGRITFSGIGNIAGAVVGPGRTTAPRAFPPGGCKPSIIPGPATSW